MNPPPSRPKSAAKREINEQTSRRSLLEATLGALQINGLARGDVERLSDARDAAIVRREEIRLEEERLKRKRFC